MKQVPTKRGIGVALRLLREQHGLTLQDVEDRTADAGRTVTRSMFSRIENGQSNTISALFAIAEAFGCEVFFKPRRSRSTGYINLTHEARRLDARGRRDST